MSKSNAIVPNITNNFTITFLNHPDLDYNISEVTQPGLNVSPQETYAGRKRMKIPPRNVDPDRDEIIVTFNVTENYSNYYEIFNWIKSFKDGAFLLEDLMTDITILHYDLNKKPIRKILLKYCWPSMVSDIALSNTDTTAEPVLFTANFVVNEIIITTL